MKAFTQSLTVYRLKHKGNISQTLCWGQQEIDGLEQNKVLILPQALGKES